MTCLINVYADLDEDMTTYSFKHFLKKCGCRECKEDLQWLCPEPIPEGQETLEVG